MSGILLATDGSPSSERSAGVAVGLARTTALPLTIVTCAAAEQRAATLVVVGAHGWGTVRRLLFRSISEAVLRRAPCPVLVGGGEQARG